MAKLLQFDAHYAELIRLITSTEGDPELKSCKNIRDKFTAHIELQFTGEEYSYPDISKYSLKWNSPKRLLNDFRPIVERIGYIVRDASFSWDSFGKQNERVSNGLWET